MTRVDAEPLDVADSTPRGPRRAALMSLAGLTAGGVAALLGADGVADLLWMATTAVVLLPVLIGILRDLRRGNVGVDLIAVLAMAGAILLGEYLAGAVIALMLSGGEALEAYAGARAGRELSALLARAPATANRIVGGAVTTVPVAEIHPGELLLVRPGEVVPVDGLVAADSLAVLDEATLTGESRPVERVPGDRLFSGTVNAGGPFTMRATATAAASTYAGIVALVREAQESKAPFQRLADRYALWFIPLTGVIAGGAWAVSGDPMRALAVLVVATPCPLILAAPIAMVAGLSRSASRGVIVKGAGALEALAGAHTLLLDKTGTLTAGQPRLTEIVVFPGHDRRELLHLAASLDQVSAHVLAVPLVRAAMSEGLELVLPTEVEEVPGSGISGRVGDRRVALGSARWALDGQLPPQGRAAQRRARLEGASAIFVAVDGAPAGVFLLDDPLRPDAPRAIAALKRAGVDRTVMVTGDRADVAELIAAASGVDAVLAERSPAEKVNAVAAAQADGITVMVGDGINDAPALAAADVGVAMGARGATASSQAADVVITVDRLDRLAEALRIAQRSRRIALQSVLAGMGMSLAAMGFAAVGLLAPVAGALLQEGIDLAVILNALRALRGERTGAQDPRRRAISEHYRDAHAGLRHGIAEIAEVARALDYLPADEAQARLTQLQAFLVDELLVHEREEERTFTRSNAFSAEEVAPLRRTHAEIARLVRLLERYLDALPAGGPTEEDRADLQRLLYGLHAVVELHVAQEDDLYLAEDDRALDVPAAHRSGDGDRVEPSLADVTR